MIPKKSTITLCGLPSIRARFRHHPATIQRLYFDHETSKKIGIICKALATSKKIYRCVTPDELVKLSGSIHHGGIVAIADQISTPVLTPEHIAALAKTRTPLLILDHIANPHNLGAIARTAAFFGLKHIIISDTGAQANTSAHRIAEGALETIEIHPVKNLPDFCRQLSQHYHLAGAFPHPPAMTPAALRSQQLKTPIALVLGNEELGISPELAPLLNTRLRIPPAPKSEIESLNVSVAAALLVHSLFAPQ